MRGRYQRPSSALLITELPRALGELGAFATAAPLLQTLPRGDGHRVLVIPGFMGDDRSTAPLRWFLTGRGYRAMPWRLGRNLGPTDEILDGMDALLERFATTEQHMSIVGWSLGGIFARELARSYAGVVRSVITLGSPFQLHPGERNLTNAGQAYGAVSVLHSSRANRFTPAEAKAPMPVPTTNIYTRADGVVPWQSCVDVHGDHCENIEVPGSHAGLGHNPVALALIADRLAQPDGTWHPFRATVGCCLRAFVRVGPVPVGTTEMVA
jgi:pimeloyl-ACP methyl ester carboxylesterase